MSKGPDGGENSPEQWRLGSRFCKAGMFSLRHHTSDAKYREASSLCPGVNDRERREDDNQIRASGRWEPSLKGGPGSAA